MKSRKSKIIAMGIVSSMIFTPIANIVYAGEISKSDNLVLSQGINEEKYINEDLLLGGSINTFSNENLYEQVKKDFISKFGTEDEFKLIAKTKEFKTEGNGFTGQLRVTTYDNAGNVENSIIIDYLKNVKKYSENLENENNESSLYAESYEVRPIRTGGPDPFSFYVKKGGNYKSKYKMHATSYYGKSKTWYKNSSWNTGYTAGLYKEIKNGRENVNNIASTLSPGVSVGQILAAFLEYIGPVAAVPGLNTVIAILAAFNLGSSAVKVAGYTLSYLKNVNVAQYNYIRI
ncbi:hypothetical protein [Romboutsia sp. 1001713B170131_170501_G6]|uniref:hypothetical protein n=1 Tax=Romboutsia sp. 1001713B170131_170501_G6 TaxID=2787108 RepID=UPI0018A8BE67|nr:hypothetical protein [Romboutsia sp. 1001713B170131_170501_G6]